MAYPVHALLRMSGRWFLTEQWSCGIRLITDQNDASLAGWDNVQESLLTSLRVYVAAWFLRATTQISQQARLDKISLNAIGPDGRYANAGNVTDYVYTATSAPQTTNAITTWPQLTTVISLRTAQERGRATHGRVYVPTAIASTADGRIPAGALQSMAQSFKTLVTDINGTAPGIGLGGNLRVGVVSNLGSDVVSGGDPGALPGPSRIVTRVLCGSVIDTQRRRRNQLVESYHTETV